MKILKNIHRSVISFSTEDYPLFLFEDILQISVKKIEKIFTKVIQYIIFENFHTNIDNKNVVLSINIDVLCYSTIIYADICTVLRCSVL